MPAPSGYDRRLLPVGVKAVEGEFRHGAAVACISQYGTELARGLANYASSRSPHRRQGFGDIETMLAMSTDQIDSSR